MSKFADAVVEMGFTKINGVWEVRFPNKYSVRVTFDGGNYTVERIHPSGLSGSQNPWKLSKALDEEHDLDWLIAGLRQEVESTKNRK